MDCALSIPASGLTHWLFQLSLYQVSPGSESITGVPRIQLALSHGGEAEEDGQALGVCQYVLMLPQDTAA